MSATTHPIFLPGDHIPASSLPPSSKKGTLTLGPGLRHLPPSTILSTTAGTLHTDPKKSALWLEHDGGRYLPSVGDLVIAQVQRSGTEAYNCVLAPHSAPASLPQLAFEGVNRKTRPQLQAGDLVYARVGRASRFEEAEIECVNPATGKGEGMGQLKGGMVFGVSLGFARRLMMGSDKAGKSKGGVVVLEEFGEKVRFEVAVGRNGRVWVDCGGNVRETIAIGRVLTAADEGAWDEETQRKAVRRALKEI